MGHREGAPNSLHTLRALPFTVLKTKSKKAVNPSNARSHGSLKPGRAVWGKRSQYSHRGPSLFLQHLHLVPANHADVCSEGSPLLSSSPPRWPAPYVHHDGGTKPSSSPIFSPLAPWPGPRAGGNGQQPQRGSARPLRSSRRRLHPTRESSSCAADRPCKPQQLDQTGALPGRHVHPAGTAFVLTPSLCR